MVRIIIAIYKISEYIFGNSSYLNIDSIIKTSREWDFFIFIFFIYFFHMKILDISIFIGEFGDFEYYN